MTTNVQTDGRLLVLVPDDELDEARYAKKARLLAESFHFPIVFLGLNHEPDKESQMRRKLITLSGIAGSEKTMTDFKLFSVASWVEVLQNELQPQDIIMCPEKFNSGSNLVTELDGLKSRMKEKIYFVPDILISSDQERREELSWAILNWAGILFLLVTGFFIEVDFDHQIAGVSRTIFQIVILTIEIALLWFWNRLFLQRENRR